MADGSKITRGSASQNSKQINNVTDSEVIKSEILCLNANILSWKGDLASLKAFVETILQLNGRWSSPRGESIQFSNPEFCLK